MGLGTVSRLVRPSSARWALVMAGKALTTLARMRALALRAARLVSLARMVTLVRVAGLVAVASRVVKSAARA